jgi:hypothetical protein
MVTGAATRKPRTGGQEGGAHREGELLQRCAHRRGGDAGERLKEWSSWPKKWSGRISFAARILLWGR